MHHPEKPTPEPVLYGAMSLPPGKGSVVRYHVRDANGTVEFSDDSPHQPSVLHKLQLVVLQAAQQVCHLPD